MASRRLGANPAAVPIHLDGMTVPESVAAGPQPAAVPTPATPGPIVFDPNEIMAARLAAARDADPTTPAETWQDIMAQAPGIEPVSVGPADPIPHLLPPDPEPVSPATEVLEGSSPEGFDVYADQATALAAAGIDAPDMSGDAVELSRGEYMLYMRQEALIEQVELLTQAVRSVGDQQQWTTDTVQQMFEQFSTLMASPGGIKGMVGMLMSGGLGNMFGPKQKGAIDA